MTVLTSSINFMILHKRCGTPSGDYKLITDSAILTCVSDGSSKQTLIETNFCKSPKLQAPSEQKSSILLQHHYCILQQHNLSVVLNKTIE